MDERSLYSYDAETARQREELPLWRASHQANIACKGSIEEAVRKHYDGAYLDNNCLGEVLREFGYKRTAWVLANTVQQLEWDGRFSPQNKTWARQIPIPEDKQHDLGFVVRSHPAVLDGVIDQYRKDCPDLRLLGPELYEPEFGSQLDRPTMERFLTQRITDRWSAYEQTLRKLSPKEILDRTEEIAAVRTCRDALLRDMDLYSDEQMTFLLSLFDPVEQLRDFWSREQEADSTEQMTCAMRSLAYKLEEKQDMKTPGQGGMTMKE